VLLAYRCALASERVTATAIEANEFPQLAQELEVWAVPKVVVNGTPAWEGSIPEPQFFQRLSALLS
jgi:hypothetical protein